MPRSSPSPWASKGRALLAAACFAFGCGGPKPAETAAATPAGPPDGADAPAATAEPSATAPESTATPAASATPAAPQPVGVLCEKMCEAQAPKCSAEQVKGCRHNYCSRYSGAPDVCEPSARAALECAQSQPDFLLCSNVVPESCAKKFFAVEKCLSTGVAPPPEPEGPKIPDGWSRYEASDAAFSALMPKGVEAKTEGGVKSWTTKSGDVTYSITLQAPPPEKKFDQKGFLRVATKLLGRCADKMKLFAIVEKPDRSMIQYKTLCPDKSQERGMLYVQGQDYFIVRARWNGEAPNPDADTFTYSFLRKK
ncbi:MAG TPA: hypothetical protein VFZ53_01775 [Polyangiaceae bacterium]